MSYPKWMVYMEKPSINGRKWMITIGVPPWLRKLPSELEADMGWNFHWASPRRSTRQEDHGTGQKLGYPKLAGWFQMDILLKWMTWVALWLRKPPDVLDDFGLWLQRSRDFGQIYTSILDMHVLAARSVLKPQIIQVIRLSEHWNILKSIT